MVRVSTLSLNGTAQTSFKMNVTNPVSFLARPLRWTRPITFLASRLPLEPHGYFKSVLQDGRERSVLTRDSRLTARRRRAWRRRGRRRWRRDAAGRRTDWWRPTRTGWPECTTTPAPWSPSASACSSLGSARNWRSPSTPENAGWPPTAPTPASVADAVAPGAGRTKKCILKNSFYFVKSVTSNINNNSVL